MANGNSDKRGGFHQRLQREVFPSFPPPGSGTILDAEQRRAVIIARREKKARSEEERQVKMNQKRTIRIRSTTLIAIAVSLTYILILVASAK